HCGGVRPSEVDLLLADRLRGLGGALAGLDLQVDAVLLEDALLYAVVERRVLTVGVPVEHQGDVGHLPVSPGLTVRTVDTRAGECRGRGHSNYAEWVT